MYVRCAFHLTFGVACCGKYQYGVGWGPCLTAFLGAFWSHFCLDCAGNSLAFTVGGKHAFDVSIADVSQTQMQGKNEVMLEFHVDDTTGASEVGPFFFEWRYKHVNFWVHIRQYPLCYWLDHSKVRLGSTMCILMLLMPNCIPLWLLPNTVLNWNGNDMCISLSDWCVYFCWWLGCGWHVLSILSSVFDLYCLCSLWDWFAEGHSDGVELPHSHHQYYISWRWRTSTSTGTCLVPTTTYICVQVNLVHGEKISVIRWRKHILPEAKA